jgi:hypothetical protein
MYFKEPQRQLARWLEELSKFNMEIQHRPGKKHTNADALSRIPGGEPCSDFNLSEIFLLPWGQPVSKGQDQEEEEMGPRSQPP